MNKLFTSTRTSCLFLILALPLLAVACGGARVVDEGGPPPNLRPAGVIVLPIAMATPDASMIEVVARTIDVANVLLRITDAPLLGPMDFSVLKPLDEVKTAAYDTDLTSRGPDLDANWQDFVALHVLVVENRATNVRDIVDLRVKDPKQPNTYRQHGVEAQLHVEAGLYDVRRGTRLAWTTVDVSDDPLAFEQGQDPRPGLTAATRKALARLVDLAGPALQSRGRRVRGEGLADSVKAMTTWKSLEGKSFAEALAGKNEVEVQARMLALWDRLYPDTPMQLVAQADKSPGVVVLQARAPLQVGDVVTHVEGKPVVTAHQLDRRLQFCGATAQGCKATVVRAGAAMQVDLAWPPLASVSAAP